MKTHDQALPYLRELLTEFFPEGRFSTHDFRIGNIDGEPGSSLSVDLQSGLYKDFATDEGGGYIDLIAKRKGVSFADAAKMIDDRFGLSRDRSDYVPPARPAKPTPSPKPEFVKDATRKKVRKPFSNVTFQYLDKDGKKIGSVAKIKTPKGGKTFRQFKANGRAGGFGNHIYRIETIQEVNDRPVYIVEGEQSAIDLSKFCKNVVSWNGGASSAKNVDWSPLENREVVIWPDNDNQGIKAALDIKEQLPDAKILAPPPAHPLGWDCSDGIADPEFDIGSFIQESKEYESPEQEKPKLIPNSNLFACLGQTDGVFWYHVKGKRLLSLTPAEHSAINLRSMVIGDYWDRYKEPESTKIDWLRAAGDLMDLANDMPPFNSKRVRAKGCWIDEGRSVFNAGTHLVVDGHSVPLDGIDSNFIYLESEEVDFSPDDMLENHEGAEILKMIEELSWAEPHFGKLVAGWTFLSTVCGIVSWRPHIWITGAAGSGKTWVVNHVLGDLLTKFALKVQGTTTEAGLRQELRSDARPVVFDEAEGGDQTSNQRIAKILELARISSSENNSGVTKGSAGGKAPVTFAVNSMFAFASIDAGSEREADKSRITTVELNRGMTVDKFEPFARRWQEMLADGRTSDRLMARAVALAPKIRENATKLSRAASMVCCDSRMGDQLGTLLAGAYSLTNDDVIDDDRAEKLVAGLGLQSMDPREEDSETCVSHLMAAILTCEGVYSVSEAVEKIVSGGSDAGIHADNLARNGLRVEDGKLFVAAKHPELTRIFRDTQWAQSKWAGSLARLDGAEKSKSSRRFFGIAARYVAIPL